MLDLDISLMVVIAVIFLAVVARLNSCLYQPLLRHMDNREADITRKLKEVEKNSADVSSYYDEANKILAEAKKEASSLRQNAISEATSMGEAKFKEVQEKLEQRYQEFVQNLQKEKEELKVALIKNAPMFKEAISKKINSI